MGGKRTHKHCAQKFAFEVGVQQCASKQTLREWEYSSAFKQIQNTPRAKYLVEFSSKKYANC